MSEAPFFLFLTAVILVLGAFFGGLVYATHTERMTCMEARGSMERGSCTFPTPIQQKD